MTKRLETKKTLLALTLLNILLIVAILSLLLLATLREDVTLDRAESFYLLLIGGIALFGEVITLLGLLPLSRLSGQIRMMNDALENLNHLNNDLRAQRHDFLNHIQVVYSLIELGEQEEAHRYLEQVYTDIQRISRVLKTAHPAINAILQAKSDMCANRGIQMSLDISSPLSGLKIPAWEMCRVLGNLIDNAIYALEEGVPEGQRQISISLKEDLKAYSFQVENNGPAIPEELQRQIFEPGFTTKGSGGEGMGLAICRRILTEHNGSLELSSSGNQTVFSGVIPR